jgi:tetratricopeptide (TPR) repeat protein
MFELKTLSPEAIPAALTQAERYRLLNEPAEAESICLDILKIDPDQQEALRILILACTDQFSEGSIARAMTQAERALSSIRDEYERLYLAGIVRERRGKAELKHDRPGSGPSAQQWLRDAMVCYERAEAIHPPGTDEALLRWNTCARILMHLPATGPDVHEYNAIQSE